MLECFGLGLSGLLLRATTPSTMLTRTTRLSTGLSRKLDEDPGRASRDVLVGHHACRDDLRPGRSHPGSSELGVGASAQTNRHAYHSSNGDAFLYVDRFPDYSTDLHAIPDTDDDAYGNANFNGHVYPHDHADADANRLTYQHSPALP